MFYEGTLQEGIASAVQQAKLVVCFVTDDQPESQQWENEFLTDERIKEPLDKHAVVLKLQAGSTEAGYLAAIFPLPKTPTLVMIRNGELKEYIVSGASKEDFISRTAKALGITVQSAPAPAPASQSASNSRAAPPAYPSASSSTQQPVSSPAPAPAAPPAAPVAAGISNERVQSLLAERAARLEVQRKQEAERRRQEARLKKAEDAPKPKVSDAQSKHLEEIRKRQRQEREARARVLQQIEDDKAARRAQQEESRQRLRGGGAAESDAPGPSQSRPMHADGSGNCKLQVRLLDGSTVRAQFPSSHRLDADVRKWVDEEAPSAAGGRAGYSFKVIQTPAPSRSIGVAEEGQTLAELGLTPSATLVLVPARTGTTMAGAYPGAGLGGGGGVLGLLAGVVAFVVRLLGGIVGFLTSMFSTAPAPVQGRGQEQGRDQGAVASGRDQSQKEGVNRARERRDDQQYYNGNSTNFEPKHEDDEDEKRQ